MSIQVGEVIAVRGVKVTLKIFDESNKDVLFYGAEKLKGISIREYIVIQRGFRDIVCMVEGEYLDESRVEYENSKVIYVRKVDVKPIGYFEKNIFTEGIKFLPMIKDPVFLITERQIGSIFRRESINRDFIIGCLLQENLPVALPWQKLFNTHIGIFGNTGSGKSNTLSKLYTTLFQQKQSDIGNKSQFVILDFNGEYTQDQLIERSKKNIFDLSTKDNNGSKFAIPESELWNAETLCLLFKATTNTQAPFIKRVVSGWEKYHELKNSLTNYFRSTFERVFTAQSQKKEAVELLLNILKVIEDYDLTESLKKVSWYSKDGHFKFNGAHFNGGTTDNTYSTVFKEKVEEITLSDLTFFDELMVRSNLQLINDLLAGYVQFEHIQPILKRIDAAVSSLNRVINVTDSESHSAHNLLTVISLRRCNQEIKKIIPLLVAKHFYEHHKQDVSAPPNKTIHIIIDEAHNVLSQQSLREQESWKDYRLELFEEIIKEGRKFGVFLTISSQRPADISPTIMSQIHNFFIHRLINDKDLQLLDNTISTLDSLSKGMIPSLAKGCCIVTGTSFDIPLLMQVDRLDKKYQPDSDDVDLNKLWSSHYQGKEEK